MWPRASSERSAGIWIAIVVGAPLLWLTMLETGYVLSHWACGTGMTWPLHLTTGSAIAILGGVLLLMPKRFGPSDTPPAFLATMALWFTAGFLLVAIASAIQPLIMPPCG